MTISKKNNNLFTESGLIIREYVFLLLLFDQGLSKGIKQIFPFTNQTSLKDERRKIISSLFDELSTDTYNSSAKLNLQSIHQNVISIKGNVTSTNTKVIAKETNVRTAESNVPSSKTNVISVKANVESGLPNVTSARVNVESDVAIVISVDAIVISTRVNVESNEPNVISTAENVNSTVANVTSTAPNVISMGVNVSFLVQKPTLSTNSKKMIHCCGIQNPKLLLTLKTTEGCTV